jgi:hypothetical protein
MATMDLWETQFNPQGNLHDFGRQSVYENKEAFVNFNYTQAPEPQHLYINQPHNPSTDYAWAAVQGEKQAGEEQGPTYRYYMANAMPVYPTNTQIVEAPYQPVDGGTWGRLVQGQGQALGGLGAARAPSSGAGYRMGTGATSGSGVDGISPGAGLGDSYSLQSRMTYNNAAIMASAPTTGVYTGAYNDTDCE